MLERIKTYGILFLATVSGILYLLFKSKDEKLDEAEADLVKEKVEHKLEVKHVETENSKDNYDRIRREFDDLK